MTYSVTITGPNCPTEIHRAGCADLRRNPKFRHPAEDFWTIDVTSHHDLAVQIWGDVATDTTAAGTPEWHQACDDNMAEYRYMPCAPDMPETDIEFEACVLTVSAGEIATSLDGSTQQDAWESLSSAQQEKIAHRVHSELETSDEIWEAYHAAIDEALADALNEQPTTEGINQP